MILVNIAMIFDLIFVVFLLLFLTLNFFVVLFLFLDAVYLEII